MKAVNKQALIDSLEQQVDAHLQQAIKVYQNLDADTLSRPSSTGGWSIAQCLEHLNSYGDYFQLIMGHEATAELQVALDLLTTNETYFFREPKHFDFLREQVLPRAVAGKTFRLWSAASSSGEEPYSLAMTLAETLGDRPWKVHASDLSARVLSVVVIAEYLAILTLAAYQFEVTPYGMAGVSAAVALAICCPHQ